MSSLGHETTGTVRDLSSRTDLGVFGGLVHGGVVPSHGVVLLEMTSSP